MLWLILFSLLHRASCREGAGGETHTAIIATGVMGMQRTDKLDSQMTCPERRGKRGEQTARQQKGRLQLHIPGPPQRTLKFLPARVEAASGTLLMVARSKGGLGTAVRNDPLPATGANMNEQIRLGLRLTVGLLLIVTVIVRSVPRTLTATINSHHPLTRN